MDTAKKCNNKMIKRTLFLLLLSLTQVIAQTPKQAPSHKRYFGLHFDFHAETGDSAVGKNLSERSMDSLLSAVKPDFIQVDCKGHPGATSYPSKVVNATTAGRFYGDPLKFYRAVTRKHGVDLYLHYSGIQDYAALKKHPDWSVVKADGTRDEANTSVHGPYVDSLLIPQLREIANYGATGIWVDGDCWATQLDYSPAAIAAFRPKRVFKACRSLKKSLIISILEIFAAGRSFGTWAITPTHFTRATQRFGWLPIGPIRA